MEFPWDKTNVKSMDILAKEATRQLVYINMELKRANVLASAKELYNIDAITPDAYKEVLIYCSKQAGIDYGKEDLK